MLRKMFSGTTIITFLVLMQLSYADALTTLTYQTSLNCNHPIPALLNALTGPAVAIASSSKNTIGFLTVEGDTTGDNITAVTWAGITMTKLAATQLPNGDRWTSDWYIYNPVSQGTVLFTGGTTHVFTTLYCDGARQFKQPDSFGTNTAPTGSARTQATTTPTAVDWPITITWDGHGNVDYTPTIGTSTVNISPSGFGIAIGTSTIPFTGNLGTTMIAKNFTTYFADLAIAVAPATSSVSFVGISVKVKASKIIIK